MATEKTAVTIEELEKQLASWQQGMVNLEIKHQQYQQQLLEVEQDILRQQGAIRCMKIILDID